MRFASAIDELIAEAACCHYAASHCRFTLATLSAIRHTPLREAALFRFMLRFDAELDTMLIFMSRRRRHASPAAIEMPLTRHYFVTPSRLAAEHAALRHAIA